MRWIRLGGQGLVVALANAIILGGGRARAESVTECTKDSFCYCINSDLRGAIEANVEKIRSRIASEKADGKAVGYLSIPISTVTGSYLGENVKIAAEVKERVERTPWRP